VLKKERFTNDATVGGKKSKTALSKGKRRLNAKRAAKNEQACGT